MQPVRSHDVKQPAVQSAVQFPTLEETMQRCLRWIEAFYRHGGPGSIYPQHVLGQISGFLGALPEQPESPERVISDALSLLSVASQWNAPGFHGYFQTRVSQWMALASLLQATINTNLMTYAASPAATEQTVVVLDWLRHLLGLPNSFFGVLNATADEGALTAFVTARDQALHVDGLEDAADVSRLRWYASPHAHASIPKAARIAGLGGRCMHSVAADAAYRLDVVALEHAIKADLAQGLRPFAVFATCGTTSTLSIDPIAAIAALCQRYGLWLHVDAAYAGAAAISPQYRWVLDGCELADSFVMNPHKWLGLPLGCSAFYTRHPEAVRRSLSEHPEYLRDTSPLTSAGAFPDYMDYSVNLTQPWRGLLLWMQLRLLGQQGIASMIEQDCQVARTFADWVRADPNFELVIEPVSLNLVCLRASPRGMDASQRNELNERLLNRINKTGRHFLTHTMLDGQFVLRVSLATTLPVAHSLWNEIRHQTSLLTEDIHDSRDASEPGLEPQGAACRPRLPSHRCMKRGEPAIGQSR